VLAELSTDQLAVVVVHEGLASLLRRPEGVPFSAVATAVGRAVQAEWNIQRLRQLRLAAGVTADRGRGVLPEEVPAAPVAAAGTAGGEGASVPTAAAAAAAAAAQGRRRGKKGRGGSDGGRSVDERALAKDVNAINYAAAAAEIADAEWDAPTAVTVGSALLDVLLKTALVQTNPPSFYSRRRRAPTSGGAATAAAASGEGATATAPVGDAGGVVGTLPLPSPPPTPPPAFVPAFRHEIRHIRTWGAVRRVGHLRIGPEAAATLTESDELLREVLAPKWKPMVVLPRPWTGAARGGGYLLRRAPLIRVRPSRRLRDALGAADLRPVLAGLNALSGQGWRINAPVLATASALWERGGGGGGGRGVGGCPRPHRRRRRAR